MTTSDPYVSGDIKTLSGEEPRPLDELLKLETYQGMTDDEIRLVIAYKEYLALKHNQIEHDREVAYARFDAFSEKCAEQMKQAQDNFNRAINILVDFKEVSE